MRKAGILDDQLQKEAPPVQKDGRARVSNG